MSNTPKSESEVEMIGPSNALRTKIGHNADLNEVFTDAVIDRAQNIINEATENFLQNHETTLHELVAILQQESRSPDDIKTLATTARNIMGQAETLGYNALSAALHSLNHCIEQDTMHPTIMQKHAQLVEAILQTNQKDLTAQSQEILQQALPDLIAHFHPSGGE